MIKKKPRLLVLTSTFPRWINDSEPPFVFELSRRLTDDFDITVLAPRAPGSQRQEVMAELRVIRFPYFIQRWENLATHGGGILNKLKTNKLNYLLVPFFLLGQLWVLLRLFRHETFDIIHAHWLIPQGFIAVIGQRLTGQKIPLVCTSHGGDLYALRHPILQRLKLWLINCSQAITVVSLAMRNHLVDKGISSNKVNVIPMGVDLQQCFIPNSSVQRNNHELLFVGRLVEKKGLRILLQAMPAILAKHPNIQLTVAGSGPLKAELQKTVRDLNIIHSVTFLGMVTQEELPKLYQRATLYVAPFVIAEDGDQEGLGLVMVEAIGCGCPVIASDLPAIHDVIEHGSTGWLVPSKDQTALSEAIINLLADNHLRETLSTGAILFIKNKFSWEVIAKRYANQLLHSAGLSLKK